MPDRLAAKIRAFVCRPKSCPRFRAPLTDNSGGERAKILPMGRERGISGVVVVAARTSGGCFEKRVAFTKRGSFIE